MIELCLIGNLGADAELRANDKGKFCTFDVAHTDKFRDSQGNLVTATSWVSVSYNRPDNVAPYLKKGVKVYVRGRVSLRAYLNKEREPRAAMNVFADDLVLLGAAPPRPDAQENAPF